MTRKERQKAIDALKMSAPVMAVTQEEFNDYIQTLNQVMDWLEQEPKTGHWIRMKAYEKWECSECNTVFRFTFKEHDYCPNCGCRMAETQEGANE